MQNIGHWSQVESVQASLMQLKSLVSLYETEYLDVPTETFAKFAAYHHEDMVNLHNIMLDIVIDNIEKLRISVEAAFEDAKADKLKQVPYGVKSKIAKEAIA